MARKELVAVAVVLAAVLALAVRGQTPTSYAKDVEPIFVKACSECHGGDNPKKGLDLSKGTGYARLVGVKSQEVPGMALIKAGEPAGSYLWLKLTHTATEGKGMPRTLFSSKKLPQAELDLVQNWIIQGANP
jgi:mono/diheme cytochrome c family protein